MTRIEIQSSIFQAVQQLSETQQQKLLDFINAMLGKKKVALKMPLSNLEDIFPRKI